MLWINMKDTAEDKKDTAEDKVEDKEKNMTFTWLSYTEEVYPLCNGEVCLRFTFID